MEQDDYLQPVHVAVQDDCLPPADVAVQDDCLQDERPARFHEDHSGFHQVYSLLLLQVVHDLKMRTDFYHAWQFAYVKFVRE